MIVIVDDRDIVTDGYKAWFDREGICVEGLCADDFDGWVKSVSQLDISAVEAFLLGDFHDRQVLSRIIKGRTSAAVIAISESRSLDETLDLFAAGVDDVVRKPVHVREILARIQAIRRREGAEVGCIIVGEIRVYSDGRDPQVCGEVLALPRRERRIFEYLAGKKECWVSKTQIFNSVYGLFNSDIDENVVESHISKLRKRLRHRLGFDPIESQRFIGYRLTESRAVKAPKRQRESGTSVT